ncbi:MAG: helix-hairpin-helix domain-containing protein [Microbacterium sp.]|uniref:helix-hairpin-helix domain-containing protein n=1 Tax=Microbacterium sp. TaxID=51671 RepID=UPI0039E3353D
MDAPEEYAKPRRRIGVGAAVVVVVLAVAVTVAVAVVRGVTTPTETVPVAVGGEGDEPGAGVDAADPATVYVHVSGAVRAPGLYRLRDGSRVVDAIAAAGGFTKRADDAAVNLARVVADGEQLVVPKRGEASTPVAGASPPAAGDGLVNLNTATEAELDTLPRIGPAMAQRILQWREANGRFTSVEDLLAVPGIGEKTVESLRPLVTV